MLIPGITVGIRRMHDTDHRGWWLLVPFVNIIFLVMDSTPGPNRFGPNPKGID
ncbi:Inner membrane protein YhaH [compost metagenome]